MDQDLKIDDLFYRYAPGVYRTQEFATRPAEFLTGVPAFIGVIRGAGEMRPQWLHFWPQFEQHFGKSQQDCFLAYAVRGFFENAGTYEYGGNHSSRGKQCCVVPLKEMNDVSLAYALEKVSHLDVDLICAPDLGADTLRLDAKARVALQQSVVKHCQSMGDRFAVLDSHMGASLENVEQQWSDLDGIDGAIYYPWVWVHGFKSGKVLSPPCGHVAGIYARTDERRGMHKAPANEVLEGVIDLERHLTDRDRLYPNHDRDSRGKEPVRQRVNLLRSFPGRGILVWGARTLSGHDSWTYVNVRRLFLTAVRWTQRHLVDVAFEPNDAKLWARIEQELYGYFLGLYRAGALKGRTAAEAFFVKCDHETNPPELANLGQVAAEIGLAPASPFEFVVVRLIVGRSGAKISGPDRSELINSN
jgi:hypothetical protein